jgi:hypothetical protein
MLWTQPVFGQRRRKAVQQTCNSNAQLTRQELTVRMSQSARLAPTNYQPYVADALPVRLDGVRHGIVHELVCSFSLLPLPLTLTWKPWDAHVNPVSHHGKSSTDSPCSVLPLTD